MVVDGKIVKKGSAEALKTQKTLIDSQKKVNVGKSAGIFAKTETQNDEIGEDKAVGELEDLDFVYDIRISNALFSQLIVCEYA